MLTLHFLHSISHSHSISNSHSISHSHSITYSHSIPQLTLSHTLILFPNSLYLTHSLYSPTHTISHTHSIPQLTLYSTLSDDTMKSALSFDRDAMAVLIETGGNSGWWYVRMVRADGANTGPGGSELFGWTPSKYWKVIKKVKYHTISIFYL